MAVDITGFNRMRREQAKREAVKQEATNETKALEDMTYNELRHWPKKFIQKFVTRSKGCLALKEG